MGNNDASAPERSNSSNCGNIFLSSAEKSPPTPEGRADKGATRRERRCTMHARMNQRKTQFNGNPTELGKHWEGKRASAGGLKLGLKRHAVFISLRNYFMRSDLVKCRSNSLRVFEDVTSISASCRV